MLCLCYLHIKVFRFQATDLNDEWHFITLRGDDSLTIAKNIRDSNNGLAVVCSNRMESDVMGNDNYRPSPITTVVDDGVRFPSFVPPKVIIYWPKSFDNELKEQKIEMLPKHFRFSGEVSVVYFFFCRPFHFEWRLNAIDNVRNDEEPK